MGLLIDKETKELIRELIKLIKEVKDDTEIVITTRRKENV